MLLVAYAPHMLIGSPRKMDVYVEKAKSCTGLEDTVASDDRPAARPKDPGGSGVTIVSEFHCCKDISCIINDHRNVRRPTYGTIIVLP